MLLFSQVRANAAQINAIQTWLASHGIRLNVHVAGATIPGSYWGEPEAGVVGNALHVRADTPLHSLLHEGCHLICMGTDRRRHVYRDAGGDDLEEAAVCYLQLCIATQLPNIGWQRLAADMDAWGYSFRCGSTAEWYQTDATDAREWLCQRGLLVGHDRSRSQECSR